MASHIERRKFLATLGGATAWPFAARARQPAMPVVSFVSSRSLDGSARHAAAFTKGLSEIDYVDGQNVVVDARGATTYSIQDLLHTKRAALFSYGGYSVPLPEWRTLCRAICYWRC
jgi:hypothetical protein